MEKFKTVIQENSANLKIKKDSDVSKLLEYIRGGSLKLLEDGLISNGKTLGNISAAMAAFSIN